MNWQEILKAESKKDYFKRIGELVKLDAEKHTVYPARQDIFKAFDLCPFDSTRVVILGMDPYINAGQAHGLAFSVPEGQPIPPSLRNIFKELYDDTGVEIPTSGCLTGWSRQFILLLNSSLTVRAGQSGSHSEFGWQIFTDQCLSYLNERESPVVFILWGAHARKKARLITGKHHLILTGSHPSPLSAYAGFFGEKYFSKTNEFLKINGMEIIDWSKTV